VLTTRRSFSAFAIALALALGGCGGDDSSNTGQTQPPPPGNGPDRAFVNSIIPLHEKAVAVAVIGETKGDSKLVKRISQEVSGSQPQETARLRAIGSALFAAGVPVGTLGVPASDAADVDLAALRKARDFDTAFLNAMIPLHEQTIALCKAEIAKGDQVDLKTTAQAMLDAEQSQLTSMQQRLRS
jgi:uncharacterized protein (DUF305 family)